MSLSRFGLALLAGLCQSLDVSVTQEPLLLGSHDTGCILERTKVQHTCEDITPQLLGRSQMGSLESDCIYWDL